jgi:hypothetical protein
MLGREAGVGVLRSAVERLDMIDGKKLVGDGEIKPEITNENEE